MDTSLLILMLLLAGGGCNNGNKPRDNNCRDGSLFGAGTFDNFDTFRDDCRETYPYGYNECCENFVTPYNSAKNKMLDMEMLSAILMFFMFKEMNAPIAAVPVPERRRRRNPFYERFDNNICDDDCN